VFDAIVGAILGSLFLSCVALALDDPKAKPSEAAQAVQIAVPRGDRAPAAAVTAPITSLSP